MTQSLTKTLCPKSSFLEHSVDTEYILALPKQTESGYLEKLAHPMGQQPLINEIKQLVSPR